MDFKAVEEMINVMDNSTLGYLEVNWDEVSIIMKKKGESGVAKVVQNSGADNSSASGVEIQKESATPRVVEESSKEDSEDQEHEKEEDENIKEICSPIVGTFYSKASPEKPDYVNVGDRVKKGDVLCIIEAMKIMNEIPSDVEGEVVEVLAKNEQMVEYGQCLFKIRVQG